MPPPFRASTREPDLREVLRVCTSRLHGLRPTAFPVESAPSGYLAEEVLSVPAGTLIPDESGPEALAPHALINGFTLAEGVRAGETLRVLGTLTSQGPLDAEGRLEPGEPSPASPGAAARGGTWRVETGSLLPPGVRALLPVSAAVLTGSRTIRLPPREDEMPPVGYGISSGARTESGALTAPPVFPAGTRLDGRLRALLLARGVSRVRIRPPFAVGIATIGDELTDVASPRESGCRHDLLGLAIEESVASLGLAVLPLGIAGDPPDAFSSLLLRARDKKVQVLVVAGGLGDGVTDRTLESVRRLDGDVILHGRLFGSRAGFCLARAHGIDILGLTGLPLLAAAQLDLLVVPALLARWGASARSWDWGQTLLCCDAPPTASGEALDSTTRVLPAVLTRGPSGESRIRAWEAETPFLPVSGGQEGWAVFPPEEPRAYYCPLRS